MKPVNFEYYDPTTKEETFKLLDELGDEAKILAGGQSLMPMLNFRAARPEYLVDINKIPGLDYIKEQSGYITIGALTREVTIEESDLIKSKVPILAEATTYIGHLPIRNKGTIGGSIAHADPAAEYPLMVKILEAEIKVESSQGSKWISGEDFFQDYLTTALQPNEVITEIKFPTPPAGSIFSFQELNRRCGDSAIVSVAILITKDGKGRCTSAKIGLGNVGPTPLRATTAEEILKGAKMNEKIIEDAATKAAESADPISDLHSSAEYKREMVKVFTKKALIQAL